MNSFLPQSVVPLAELTTLMLPSSNIILPRTSSPIISQIQCSLLGAFKMSHLDSFFTREQAMEMLFASVNARLPDSFTNPYGDARSTWRLPQPAVMVRCRGDGRHTTGERMACSENCHHQHVELAESCETPCRKHFRRCEYHMNAVCSAPHMVPYWTGLQIISLLLPPWLTAQKTPFNPRHFRFWDGAKPKPQELEDAVYSQQPWAIRGGEIIYGSMNKQAVGQGHRSIVHHILLSTVSTIGSTEVGMPPSDDSTGQYTQRNRLAANRFISGLVRMALNYICHEGFSVGISDAIITDARTKARIDLAIYGVKPPEVAANATFAEKIAADPVKYSEPRFELAKDDAKAVPIETLKRFKIPYDPKKDVGVERAVAKLIQDHYRRERMGRTNDKIAEQALSAAQRVERLETRIRSACEKTRDNTRNIVQASLSLSNNIAMMISAGTKGSWINAAAIMACVGPQSSNGRRVCDRPILSFNTKDFDGSIAQSSSSSMPMIRWYAHTLRGVVQGAAAGGMVKTGYIDGCTPHDFHNSAFGGRDGLLDTALRTADTGYLQRRLIKIQEGVRMAADGTLRNEANRVSAYVGAGVRMDPRFLMSTTCEPLVLSQREFEMSALITPGAEHDWDILDVCSANSAAGAEAARRERTRLKTDLEILRNLPDYDNSGGKMRLAGDINDILVNAMHQSGCAQLLGNASSGYTQPSKMDANDEWRAGVVAATTRLRLTPLSIERAVSLVEAWRADKEVAKHDFVTLTNALLHLTAKQLLVRYQMPEEILLDVLDRYRRFLIFARAQAGDGIGILSSQSLGEPLTQLTLQTFYVAGRQAEVTLGVPRMMELVSMRDTAKMLTPMVEVKLDQLRTFGELAKSERFRLEPLATHAALADIYGQRELDNAIANGLAHVRRNAACDSDGSQQILNDVLRSVDRFIGSQYSWTLGSMFDLWTIAPSPYSIGSSVGEAVSLASITTVSGVCTRASNSTCLVARATQNYVAVVNEETASASADDRRAYIDIVACHVSAALLPVTGHDMICVGVPLFDDNDRWLGVAIVAFNCVAEKPAETFDAGRSKRTAMFDTIRLKRNNIPVLHASFEKTASSFGVIEDLAIEFQTRLLSTATEALDVTRMDRDEDGERRQWFEQFVLAPIRRELPRIVLDEIIDDAVVEFIPLESVERNGARVAVPIPGANESESLSTSIYYNLLDPLPSHCKPAGAKYAFCRTDIGCLGSFVLIMRLNRQWFSLTMYSTEMLRDAVADFIGDCFDVFIGDSNSADYIALHIRVRTCRLDDAAKVRFNGSKLAIREQLQQLKPYVVHTQSMLSNNKVDNEWQMWQTADDRTDRALRPLSDESFLREMRIDLGCVPSPDNMYVVALLARSLVSELRRLLRAAKTATDTTPPVPPTIDEAQRKVFDKDLQNYTEWMLQVKKFLASRLPRTDHRRVEMPDLPLSFATQRASVTEAVIKLMTSIGAVVLHLSACLNYIDSSTPAEKVFVESVRSYFLTAQLPDPLGSRDSTSGIANVTQEDIDNEHSQLQTQLENDTLTRLMSVLRMFYFTGKSSVSSVKTRELAQQFYVPEAGIRFADTTVVDVATTDFSAVANFRGIDQTRAVSNAILEVAKVLGIEAARYVLITQYADVFRVAGPNAATNHANLALLANIQTSHGYCLPISRQGAKRLIYDSLQSASFELAPLVFLSAAISRAKVTDIKSPSSSMMLALNTPGFGTSASDTVMYDWRKLQTMTSYTFDPIETTIEMLYPLSKPIGLTVPSKHVAQSPLVSFAQTYDTTFVVPPTRIDMQKDIDAFEIDQAGSFSPMRRGGSVEPDSDDDVDDKQVPQQQQLPRTSYNHRRKPTTVYAQPGQDAYDPAMPQMSLMLPAGQLAAPVAATQTYDPTRPALTAPRFKRQNLSKVYF